MAIYFQGGAGLQYLARKGREGAPTIFAGTGALFLLYVSESLRSHNTKETN
jgi:hypothetical protein